MFQAVHLPLGLPQWGEAAGPSLPVDASSPRSWSIAQVKGEEWHTRVPGERGKVRYRNRGDKCQGLWTDEDGDHSM